MHAVNKKTLRHAATPLSGPSHRTVYILCDSTGNLPRHMMAAFATQFPAGALKVDCRTFIRNEAELLAILETITRVPGVVLHAFVSSELKRIVDEHCIRARLPFRDLTGDFVQFLAEHSGLSPICSQDRLHELDETYYRRVKSVEFALAHDDGLGMCTLENADIVLTGVSRTGKTPTSIYLAQQGLMAANVSLAVEVEPPRELLALPSKKVVGLVIDPRRLVEIRNYRRIDLGISNTSYNDPQHVAREVRWSRQLFERQGWPVLDVTYQAVEETATRAVELIKRAPAVSS